MNLMTQELPLEVIVVKCVLQIVFHDQSNFHCQEALP